MPSSRALADPASVSFRFHLLGKFSVARDGVTVDGLESSRSQFLLAYLLVNRKRPHSREALSALFWGDSPQPVARKYLRQALWQLQQGLQPAGAATCSPLIVEPDWVRVNTSPPPVLDIQEFEELCARGDGVAGKDLSEEQARCFQRAVALYEGDLLDGCYQDWCIYERERLQRVLLATLGKLISFNAARGDYDRAVAHGEQVLAYDRASEHTYGQLMRIKYLAGDRTSALRYYDRCVVALREELDIEPQGSTVRLYKQIRADYLDRELPMRTGVQARDLDPDRLSLAELRTALMQLESQVGQTIQAIDGAMSSA